VRRPPYALALAAVLLALPLQATPRQAPLLVIVRPAWDPPPPAGELDRAQAALVGDLDPASPETLGLTHPSPMPAVAPILRQIADGEDAWYRAAFDEADERLRDALGWALERPRAAAAEPELASSLHRAALLVLALHRVASRDPRLDDRLRQALAWWGHLPLPPDEFPPDLLTAADTLRDAPDACMGAVAWQVVGEPLPGWQVDVGARRLPLEAGGASRVPCGTWPLALVPPTGRPPAWIRSVTVTPDPRAPISLSPSLEAHVRTLGSRSLEVEDHEGLGLELGVLAGDVRLAVTRLVLDAGGRLRAQPLALDPGGILRPLPDETPPEVAAILAQEASEPLPAHVWAPWTLYGVAALSLGAAVALHVQTNRWVARQNEGDVRLGGAITAGKAGAWTGYGVAVSSALAGAIWQVIER